MTFTYVFFLMSSMFTINGKRCNVAHDDSQHIQRVQTSLGFSKHLQGQFSYQMIILYIPSARRRSRLYKIVEKIFLKQIFYILFQPTKKRKRGVGVYREGESDKSQDQRPSSSEEVGKLKMDRDRQTERQTEN